MKNTVTKIKYNNTEIFLRVRKEKIISSIDFFVSYENKGFIIFSGEHKTTLKKYLSIIKNSNEFFKSIEGKKFQTLEMII